jgi:hypothetical protein
MNKGRPKTTGRYETRQELEESVWRQYYETAKSIVDISRFCKVSATVVSNILDDKGTKPK